AVAQDPSFHARAVHEHAVEAAIVEHADAVGLAHDQRMAARDRGVVEAHVGREAATDTRPLTGEGHRADLAALLVAEVLARLVDLLARAGEDGVPVAGIAPGKGTRGQGRPVLARDALRVEEGGAHELLAAA